MKNKVAITIGLQSFLIVILFWMVIFYGRDEYEDFVQGSIEEEIETPNRISVENDITIVTISTEAQRQSGIATSTLVKAEYLEKTSALGMAMALDTLIDLRARYFQALSDAASARAAVSNSRQDLARMQVLNRDNRNISDRAVMSAEAILKSDEARLQAAEALARNLKDAMRQQWGDTLANEATQANHEGFSRLLSYKEILLRITMPFDSENIGPGTVLQVSPIGSSSVPIQAKYVSSAPLVDMTIPGKTYFFRAPAEQLRAGMRLSVQLQGNESPLGGVIVPNSAIVWYGGKAWAYRKESETRFVRLPVNTRFEAANGWFNDAVFLENDKVVTTGAQLLLSEEFKYQITNENDD